MHLSNHSEFRNLFALALRPRVRSTLPNDAPTTLRIHASDAKLRATLDDGLLSSHEDARSPFLGVHNLSATWRARMNGSGRALRKHDTFSFIA